MHRIYLAFGLCSLLLACPRPDAGQDAKDAGNPRAGLGGGDPARGKPASGARKASGPETRRYAHVRLLHNNAPAVARVSIAGTDGKSYGPAGAAIRKTKRGEPYFYAD